MMRIFLSADLREKEESFNPHKQERLAMRSYSWILLFLAVSSLVCPSCARYGQGGRGKKSKATAAMNLPTPQQQKMLEQRATIDVHNEMGDDANEEELMRRVDEVMNARMREKFPDAFKPKTKFQTNRAARSDDIWENGTVVRWMARVIAALLGMAMLYAFKEQLMGRETWDGQKIEVASKETKEGKKDM